MGLSYLQNRYTKFSTKQSEEFNTASRSIKPGLIASGIVSAWTWAATLLQSSTVAYEYGSNARTVDSALTRIQIWHCWTFLVCCRSNSPDPNVLHTGLQSQDERATMPHLPRDSLCALRPGGAPRFSLLRLRDQHLGRIAIAARRQRCGHRSDWNECLRCYILNP